MPSNLTPAREQHVGSALTKRPSDGGVELVGLREDGPQQLRAGDGVRVSAGGEEGDRQTRRGLPEKMREIDPRAIAEVEIEERGSGARRIQCLTRGDTIGLEDGATGAPQAAREYPAVERGVVDEEESQHRLRHVPTFVRCSIKDPRLLRNEALPPRQHRWIRETPVILG